VGVVPEDELPYAVLDLDSTLSDARHRLHFIERRPKDWDSFFAGSKDDPPLEEGLAVAATLAEGHEIVYVTGRPERIRRDTERWLDKHGLPPGRVYMRSNTDRRPSAVTKTALFRMLAARRRIAVIVDDDLRVCRSAERAGFTVMHADWGIDDDSAATLFDAQQSEGRT
jgi:phosphoglycolate phosphatase-like HAD superfamily hydrolase